jgi:hypothetical protein
MVGVPVVVRGLHFAKPCCRPGQLNLLCAASNVGKIWSSCGHNELRYAMKKEKVFMCSYTCVFVYASCAALRTDDDDDNDDR